MPLTLINIGTIANDGTGNPNRTAFNLSNTNDQYLENYIQTVETLVTTGAVNTNKIFVDKSGNDTTGTGTNGKPYLTIAKAIIEYTSGDEIYVNPGTYTESFTLPANSIFTAPGADITGNITVNGKAYINLKAITGNFIIGASGDLYIKCLDQTGTVTNSGSIRGIIDDTIYDLSLVNLEKVGEETATGSTGETVSFTTAFPSGTSYIINLDYRGVNIGVQITAQDENGFTYDSDSSGTFGYACKKIND